MTTGPSSKSLVTQERCLRDLPQVGYSDILNNPGEILAVIEFNWTPISHSMIVILVLGLGVGVMSTFMP